MEEERVLVCVGNSLTGKSTVIHSIVQLRESKGAPVNVVFFYSHSDFETVLRARIKVAISFVKNPHPFNGSRAQIHLETLHRKRGLSSMRPQPINA